MFVVLLLRLGDLVRKFPDLSVAVVVQVVTKIFSLLQPSSSGDIDVIKDVIDSLRGL